MRRLLAVPVLAAAALLLPVAALAATKPVPVSLSGTLFNNKPNAKITIKLGGSLRFTWKNGFHNVLTSKAPAGANKVNTGAPTPSHKPVTFKPTKKGTYRFYCLPHKALGMVLTLTVK
jgi:plastocyanin